MATIGECQVPGGNGRNLSGEEGWIASGFGRFFALREVSDQGRYLVYSDINTERQNCPFPSDPPIGGSSPHLP